MKINKTMGLFLTSVVLGGVSLIDLIPIGSAVVFTVIFILWAYMGYDAIREQREYWCARYRLNERSIRRQTKMFMKTIENNQRLMEEYGEKNSDEPTVYNGKDFINEM